MTEETLVLVPTPGERSSLERGRFPDGITLELSGFGPVAAAARTAQLLEARRPRQVLLLGIGGTFDEDRCPIESVVEPDEVALDGVGVGSEIGSRELGFPQWSGDPEIHDRIALTARPGDPCLLLTVCAASAEAAEALARQRRFPGALVEDMEGFGVALACRLADVPLRILRGISNRVGDRDHRKWRIQAALDNVREQTVAILEA